MVGFALPIKDATSSIPIGIFLRGITTSSFDTRCFISASSRIKKATACGKFSNEKYNFSKVRTNVSMKEINLEVCPSSNPFLLKSSSYVLLEKNMLKSLSSFFHK